MTDAIVIRIGNAMQVTPEEAKQLEEALRTLSLDGDVRFELPESRRYGITLYEVLHISLLGGALVGVAFGASKAFGEEIGKRLAVIVVDWARDRIKKRGSTRPVYFSIRGPDGQVIKSVLVKNVTDEPEDRTEEDRRRGTQQKE